MAGRGRTVRMRFLDGQERTFPQVRVDQDIAGWLFLTPMHDSPRRSGVARLLQGIDCSSSAGGTMWTRTWYNNGPGQEGVL